MQNFARVVRLALRQPWTLASAAFCCLLVAALWGANLGSAGPLVEVVFRGQSLRDWIDREIAAADAKAADLAASIAQLRQDLAAAPAAQQAALARKIAYDEARLEAEREAARWARAMEPFVDKYLPATPFATLMLLVAIVFVGTILKDALLVVNVYLIERLSQRVVYHLRTECYAHALDMDLAAFGQNGASGVMSRLTYDLDAIGSGLNALFGRTVREPLKMIACLAGAALISWRLLLVSLIVAPLALFLISRLAATIKLASRRALDEMSRLFERLSETLHGIVAVKAFTMEEAEASRFRALCGEYYRKSIRISLFNALVKPTTELLGMSVICLALLAGGYLVLNQETRLFGIPMADRPLGVGAIMAFFALLVGAADPVRKISDVLACVQRGSAAADRVMPLLDQRATITDPPAPAPIPRRGEVVFEGVDFHYHPGAPVLRGVSLSITEGQTLAIVGPNGCGKTTLANLLCRFYDPVAGAVRLGGVDLRELSLRDLRRQIGLVTQQTVLFDDTVLANIRYGSPQATEAEVVEAAKRAHAHRFIEEKLDAGYQTVVGEGGKRLSGGQRQRIALARAMLRDPRILVLDEATSQVDPESERLIHEALREFVHGRTAIMITHRSSTLELAHRILVMDGGRVLDHGTHRELSARCDLYRRLYQVELKQSA